MKNPVAGLGFVLQLLQLGGICAQSFRIAFVEQSFELLGMGYDPAVLFDRFAQTGFHIEACIGEFVFIDQS